MINSAGIKKYENEYSGYGILGTLDLVKKGSVK